MISASELIRQCDALMSSASRSESRMSYEYVKRFNNSLEAFKRTALNKDVMWDQEGIEARKSELMREAVRLEWLLSKDDWELSRKVAKRSYLRKLIKDVGGFTVQDGQSAEDTVWLRYLAAVLSKDVETLALDVSEDEEIIKALEEGRARWERSTMERGAS